MPELRLGPPEILTLTSTITAKYQLVLPCYVLPESLNATPRIVLFAGKYESATRILRLPIGSAEPLRLNQSTSLIDSGQMERLLIT